jgi:hypothetical protein
MILKEFEELTVRFSADGAHFFLVMNELTPHILPLATFSILASTQIIRLLKARKFRPSLTGTSFKKHNYENAYGLASNKIFKQNQIFKQNHPINYSSGFTRSVGRFGDGKQLQKNFFKPETDDRILCPA